MGHVCRCVGKGGRRGAIDQMADTAPPLLLRVSGQRRAESERTNIKQGSSPLRCRPASHQTSDEC